METVVYIIGDLTDSNRRAAELLVGHSLTERQQIRIEVTDPAAASHPVGGDDQALPDWFNVYEGMSSEEIDDITNVILSNRFVLRRPVVE
jgi:hypothetical protein